MLILASAVLIAVEAIQRWTQVHVIPLGWALGVAGVNVVIKEALYEYKLAIGKRTGSTALIAAAWDHRADALYSLAVLVGLGVVVIGGPAWRWADELAALVVAVGIVIAGAQLLKRSLLESLDPQAHRELVDAIRASATTVPGVHGIESLWVRKSGLEHFVDIMSRSIRRCL